MAVDYGVGVIATLDLPDPCVVGSGEIVAAVGLAARVLTPTDAPQAWSEPTPVACVNVREMIGQRLDARQIADWERRCNEALGQDERARTVTATITNQTSGAGITESLAIAIAGTGSNGPFSFVVSVDAVTAQILRGSA